MADILSGDVGENTGGGFDNLGGGVKDGLFDQMKNFFSGAPKSEDDAALLEQQRLDDEANALFDTNVTTLDSISKENEDTTGGQKDGIDKLAETILAAQKGTNDGDKSDFDKFLDATYGDDLKLEKLFEEGAEPDDIRADINQEIKSKFDSFAKNILAQAVRLANEKTDEMISEKLKSFTTEQKLTTGVSRLHEELPFTTKPEFKGPALNTFKLAMEKSGNNIDKSIQLMKHIYKKTNPALFDSFEDRGFSSPSNSNGNQAPAQSFNLDVNNIDAFLNG